ncbi:MAG TPA: hypothetical protein VHB21_15520, partial [Minicystis sp.]|nr:hypothetical protein [Minicystis sp.]
PPVATPAAPQVAVEGARALVGAMPPLARSNASPRELVELVWFDERALAPLRATPRWAEILASIQPPKPAIGYDDDPPPEEPAEAKDRRDVFGVLTLGAPESPDELEELVESSAGDRGTFTPPLALVAGELAFPFDELETLRATLTAVAPFTPADKKLKELVDTVNELLKTPWLQSSGSVTEGLLQRVRDAFAAQNRGLSPGQLDAHTERILLEQRHFQRRTVFGAPHLRALLSPAPAGPPVVAYLPEALATKLPMYQRLRARLVVEVNLPQDQFEASPMSLRALALGRVSAPLRRR